MAEITKIEWADHTWSPWEGCTQISPACDLCYAKAMNLWLRGGENWGVGAPRREYSEAHWAKPLAWNAKAARTGISPRVFPSVCDPFDKEVRIELRVRFLRMIWLTPRLTWLLLTKRIGNVKPQLEEAFAYVSELPGEDSFAEWICAWRAGLAPSNVWLGATVVNQEEVDRDIPKLLTTPALLRFISVEPMLAPVDLTRVKVEVGGDVEILNALSYDDELDVDVFTTATLDWVIVGGESGRGARSMVLGWAKDVVRQCQVADVPVLVKQLGARPTNREGDPHPVTDRKGGDMTEWPVVLRVRELPRHG